MSIIQSQYFRRELLPHIVGSSFNTRYNSESMVPSIDYPLVDIKKGDVLLYIGTCIDSTSLPFPNEAAWTIFTGALFDKFSCVCIKEATGTESGSIDIVNSNSSAGSRQFSQAYLAVLRGVEPTIDTLFKDSYSGNNQIISISVDIDSDNAFLMFHQAGAFLTGEDEGELPDVPTGMTSDTVYTNRNTVLTYYQKFVNPTSSGTKSTGINGSFAPYDGDWGDDGGSALLFSLPPKVPSAIEIVGSTYAIPITGGILDVMDYPPDIKSGDAILFVSSNVEGGNTYKPGDGGWTADVNTSTEYVAHRTATGSESSQSLQLGSGSSGRPCAACLVLRGANSDPLDISYSTDITGGASIPDVDPTGVENCMSLLFAMGVRDSQQWKSQNNYKTIGWPLATGNSSSGAQVYNSTGSIFGGYVKNVPTDDSTFTQFAFQLPVDLGRIDIFHILMQPK